MDKAFKEREQHKQRETQVCNKQVGLGNGPAESLEQEMRPEQGVTVLLCAFHTILHCRTSPSAFNAWFTGLSPIKLWAP